MAKAMNLEKERTLKNWLIKYSTHRIQLQIKKNQRISLNNSCRISLGMHRKRCIISSLRRMKKSRNYPLRYRQMIERMGPKHRRDHEDQWHEILVPSVLEVVMAHHSQARSSLKGTAMMQTRILTS